MKSQTLVFLFGAWVFLTILAMTLLGSLDPVTYFIVCLLGFLIIFDLSGPFTVNPRWKSRVQLLTVIGIAIFAVIAAQKLIEIIVPRYL